MSAKPSLFLTLASLLAIGLSGCTQSEEQTLPFPPNSTIQPPDSSTVKLVEYASYTWTDLNDNVLGFVNLTAYDDAADIRFNASAHILPREGSFGQLADRKYDFAGLIDRETGALLQITKEPLTQIYSLNSILFGDLQSKIGDPILIRPSSALVIAPHPLEYGFSAVGNATLAFPQELIPSALSWPVRTQSNPANWGAFSLTYSIEEKFTRVNGTAACVKYCTFNYAPQFEGPNWSITALVDSTGIWPLEFGYMLVGSQPTGAMLIRTHHEGRIEIESNSIRAPTIDVHEGEDCGILPCENNQFIGLDDAWTIHELNPNWISFSSEQETWLQNAEARVRDGPNRWAYEFVGSNDEARRFLYEEIQPGVIVPISDMPTNFYNGPEFYETAGQGPLFQNLDDVLAAWLSDTNLSREDLNYMSLFVRAPLHTPDPELRADFRIRVVDESAWWIHGSLNSGEISRIELIE
jgi:hypothetical protein